jgi:hypothetical protein
LLADGATGSLDAVGVDFELVRVELEELVLDTDTVDDAVENSELEELADDLVEVENVAG